MIVAADFFTVDVWTRSGPTSFAVLFVLDLSTRRSRSGIPSEPDTAWMNQVSRNVTAANDGFLTGKRLLIHDRDPLFTVAFRETLAATGVKTVPLAPRSPNLNAHAERFVRSIKESCLDRMILVGEESLRRAVASSWSIITSNGIIRDWATRRSSPLWLRRATTGASFAVSGSAVC